MKLYFFDTETTDLIDKNPEAEVTEIALAWPLWATGAVNDTGLVTLAKHFGIEHQAHSAMGDVKASIKVWEALFDLYIYKPRVRRDALLEIAADPQTDETLRAFAKLSAEGGVL